MAKRGRKPKLTSVQLRESGYIYKLDRLSPKEKIEHKLGKKVIVNGRIARADGEDFDYFYKTMPEIGRAHV